MGKMNLLITAVLCFAVAAVAGEPTDLDTLFRGMEYKPVLSDSLRDTTTVGAEAVFQKSMASVKVSSANDYYVLQLESVSDFDEAQRKKNQYAATTGYEVEVVFEAPFYKLRAGGWNSKKTAEDKAQELAAQKFSVLVVKVNPPKEGSKDKSKDKSKEKSKDKPKDKPKDKESPKEKSKEKK